MAYKTLLPLQSVSKKELEDLHQILWPWPTSNGDGSSKTARLTRLAPYENYYKNLTEAYECDLQSGEQMALTCHKDLFRIIKELKAKPDVTRTSLLQSAFPSSLEASKETSKEASSKEALPDDSPEGSKETLPEDSLEALKEASRKNSPKDLLEASKEASPERSPEYSPEASYSTEDQSRALKLAVQTMYMINCTAHSRSIESLEDGLNNKIWKDSESFVHFFQAAFEMSDHPSINEKDLSVSTVITKGLTARKLNKTAGITCRPTNDLREHLKLDKKNGVLRIFHQTAFLKEHLRITKDGPQDLSLVDSFKKGALPRQLALEVLDSIQKLVFPLTDPKSVAILRALTVKCSFDPDCLRFDSTAIRHPDEKDVQYLYFGARLITLMEELENPTPRGGVQIWFQRRSGVRYVAMVAIVSLIIAVILGMASLGVGSYVAWVAYQAWKHPVR